MATSVDLRLLKDEEFFRAFRGWFRDMVPDGQIGRNWNSSNKQHVIAGAAVAQRLVYSPPTTAIRARSSAGSLPDSRTRQSCWTMPLAGGFPLGPPASPRPCIPAPLRLRVSLHVTFWDDGHLRVPAGKPRHSVGVASPGLPKEGVREEIWLALNSEVLRANACG
ncbi:hypothetical protein PR048_027115 [Dryococelus australis]|uniref:Uncharacterized protein n=1 Tax=Dryococelus australis TaxID=614101 RepID=A0ABQ9GEI7_9NEOP|nr:hypothetical protein PR048_027115 [Dryococelus australis]